MPLFYTITDNKQNETHTQIQTRRNTQLKKEQLKKEHTCDGSNGVWENPGVGVEEGNDEKVDRV